MFTWEEGAETPYSRPVVHLGLFVILMLVLTGCCTGLWFDRGSTSPSDTTVQTDRQTGGEDAGAEPRTATISRVVDGDTVTVVPDQHFPADYSCSGGTCTEHVIRLAGIDAPELYPGTGRPQACGADDAIEHLTQWLMRQEGGVEVVVTPETTTEQQGRTLAYVQVETPAGLQDMGLVQTTYGYATARRTHELAQPANHQTYVAAQSLAQQHGLGLHITCPGFGRD